MTPRITADNLAEHVERQEQAVFDAAVRLFTERGYENVTLADIAAEVGLARNSLYRYFPGKSEILARWANRELESGIERSSDLLAGDEPPIDRIDRWVDDQMEYAGRPEHDLLAAMAEAKGDLDPATRNALAENHQRLREPLVAVVVEAGVEPDSAEMIADLIVALVHAAHRRREQHPGEEQRVKRKLHQGISGLLTGS